MDNQLTIFDIMYPKYKITKPVRMITLFSGYDSQCLAMKYLGVSYEHWKTCEWAVKSIQALKDIHFENDNTDYSKELTIEQVKDYLFNKGTSSNYNEPMTQEQIKRLSESQARTIYNNINATHNLVNIQQVKGKDLDIKDTDKYDYILTYSFPCQDLSLAGKGKGMSDTSTRSGMLWEVERILSECYELGTLPNCLIMENVPQVHGEGNVEFFNKFQLRLEELGYKNYVQDLIATDYGIPQTRNRCFMISILGNYSYTFPKPIPLKLKLKDMLEDNVDDKYYLSDKTLLQISNWKSYQNPLDSVMGNESISPTITTRIAESQDGGINASMKVYCNNLDNTSNLKKYYLSNKMIDYITSKDDKYKVNENKLVINREIACSKTTREGWTRADTSDYICKELPENTNILRIKNATKQGYLEATDGDGIDISSGGNDRDVVINKIDIKQKVKIRKYEVDIDNLKKVLKEHKKYSNKEISNKLNVPITTVEHWFRSDDSFSIPDANIWYKLKELLEIKTNEFDESITTFEEKDNNYEKSNRCYFDEGVAPTLTATSANEKIISNLRIRKLTPRECFRLMGVKDEDFDKVKKNQSDSSLYHLAGDSIVVNVLMAIFGELL